MQFLVRRKIIQPQMMALNKAVPTFLHRFGIRFKVQFAAGLWPVRVNPAELELALAIIVGSFDETMQAGEAITVAAVNIQFQEPKAATGLIGKYVALSLDS